VLAYRYVERDRVLVPGDERYLGRTPLKDVRLPPGSYLIVFKRAGCRDVRYPVLLKRGVPHVAEVNLYSEEEIGREFVYVPAGAFIAGGDGEAVDSLQRAEIVVGDFAIGRYPVTLGDYCQFLDDLDRTDPGLAMRRAPHDSSEGYIVQRNADGRWEPRSFLEGEARKMFPFEDGHLSRIPVMLIDWFDAVAYCRWRTARDGVETRLPLETEWEKAARGSDGRFHPWGDHFDPTFCLMRLSRPSLPQPEPVGTFSVDSSPYGVGDMAGGMREWAADLYGERTWQETSAEPEPAADTERDRSTWRILRSGSWVLDAKHCRSAFRGRFFALARYSHVSFRIAKSLQPRRA
jgi:serine/threonine-protein kinase